MNNVHSLPRRQVYPWRTTAILDDGSRVTEVLPATDSQQAEERLYRRLPTGAKVLRLAAVRLAPVADHDLPDTVPVPLDPPTSPRRMSALPRQAPAAVGTPQGRAWELRALISLIVIGTLLGLLAGCGGGDLEEIQGPPFDDAASAPTTRLIQPPRDRSVL